jgi:hypothetical protein
MILCDISAWILPQPPDARSKPEAALLNLASKHKNHKGCDGRITALGSPLADR